MLVSCSHESLLMSVYYIYMVFMSYFFFFKQKTAYEMRISDWSSDVCSSDLSMDFVSWKDRKGLATALKEIYRATDADAAEKALTAFEAGPWGQRYAAIGQSWRRAWSEVIPFFAFPDEVRRIVYTTNAIEALNSKLRRAVRARGHFPSDEAATKLLYLVLNRSEKEWKMPPREWSMAKAQFAVIFGERFIRAMAA